MKRVQFGLWMAVFLLLTMLLASCGQSVTTPVSTAENTVQSPSESDPSTAATTTQSPAEIPKHLTEIKIGDHSLAEYTIVYARSELYTLSKMTQYRDYLPVYDFDKETAERLADLIEIYLGIRLPMKMDRDITATEKEILVGRTNRSQTKTLSLSLQNDDTYQITVDDGKLVICGNVYGTTWHALDYLESLFQNALSSQDLVVEFNEDYSFQGSYHMIRIGCIGDSITAGVGASVADKFSYPAQLGRYLWKDALVTNYGNSGKTMRSDLADAYNKTQEYKDCLAAAPDLDIVTIMLGTNDSNRDRSWTAADDALFNDSGENLVNTILAKNPNLRFVLCTCPSYFGGDGFASTRVVSLVRQMVPKLVTQGKTVDLFDMRNATRNMKDLFPDQLHPNNQGHMEMAEAFSRFLQTLIDQNETVSTES